MPRECLLGRGGKVLRIFNLRTRSGLAKAWLVCRQHSKIRVLGLIRTLLLPNFSYAVNRNNWNLSIHSFYTLLSRCRIFHCISLDLYTIDWTPSTSDRPVARPLPKYGTTQHRINAHTHTHTPHIHALSGIRTHDPSVQASEDSSCLRPLG
jgi:hypothetical protein